MDLAYTGIQMRAMVGLMQNQGMSTPDVTVRLAELFQLAAITQYHNICDNITTIPLTYTVDSFTGLVSSVWEENVGYAKDYLVSYLGQVYKAKSIVPANTTFQGVSYWELQTLSMYVTFDITWTTVSPPSWLTDTYIESTVNGGTFNEDFTSITFDHPLLTSETSTINLLLHKIFYATAQDFPHMLDATPQQFINYWGDGPLITRAHSRTAELFPSGAGTQVFANVIGQARSFAQQTKQVMTAAARSQYGSEDSPAHVSTGGLSALAGNTDLGMQTVGQAFIDAGDLISLQQPHASLSAMQILWKILQSGFSYIGNTHEYMLNQVVVDPESGITVIIDSVYLDLYINNSNRILKNTKLDQLLVQMADQKYTTADVLSIKDFLNITADAAKFKRFSDLLDESIYFGSKQNESSAISIITKNANEPDLVTAITRTIEKNLDLQQITTPTVLGAVMMNMQTLDGLDLLASSEPISEIEFHRLQASFGVGGGVNGSLQAADCLGETNYLQTINDLAGVLSRFHSTGLVPHGNMALVVDNYDALWAAVFNNDLADGILSDGNVYTTWVELIVTFKTLVDPIAVAIRDQVIALGLDSYLYNYNRLAESHNMSTYIRSAAPLHYTIPYSGSSGSNISGDIIRETATASAGQTVFTLTTFTYVPASGMLTVYISGVRQLLGEGYSETSSSSVTFSEAVPTGAEVLFELLDVSGTISNSDPYAPLGTPSSRPIILDFVRSLPSYGEDYDAFLAQQLIENCCEDNVTGESIRGVMREARNRVILTQAGIGTRNNSASTNVLSIDNSAPGLIGGGQWPDPPINPTLSITDL